MARVGRTSGDTSRSDPLRERAWSREPMSTIYGLDGDSQPFLPIRKIGDPLPGTSRRPATEAGDLRRDRRWVAGRMRSSGTDTIGRKRSAQSFCLLRLPGQKHGGPATRSRRGAAVHPPKTVSASGAGCNSYELILRTHLIPGDDWPRAVPKRVMRDSPAAGTHPLPTSLRPVPSLTISVQHPALPMKQYPCVG